MSEVAFARDSTDEIDRTDGDGKYLTDPAVVMVYLDR